MGELTTINLSKNDGDVFLVKLAREIAIDHFPLATILERHQISSSEWEALKRNPRFSELLESESRAWQSATNTEERTKLKAAAMIEEWLPEAHTRMHSTTDTLNAKVELAKLIARIAGMGTPDSGAGAGVGERFSVTINLGADKELKFEKDAPVIDAKTLE